MSTPRSVLFPSLFTEAAIAQSFADLFGITIRYDHKRQRFLLWKTHYWEEDKTQSITRLFLHYVSLLADEGEKNKDTQLQEWSTKLQSHAKIKNILSLAKATLPIALSGDEFDTQPFLLGVNNGILDLTTGKLRNGAETDYISMKSPIDYDPQADCPLWYQFIDTVFEGDGELIHYVQRALGYSITASMREQLFFLCYGNGGNGKTILFNVVSHILGDYAATTSTNMFKKNPYNTTTNDMADIDRKRLVINSESIRDMVLDEERIKSLSGGDKITARRLHENNFSFKPVCKIWLYTNNYPKTDDTSEGILRRLRVIDFPHTFRGTERILDYDKILLVKEAPGILRWLVEGCLMWQEEGLQDMPKSITRAIETYKTENNPLIEFIDEKCVREEGESIKASILYAHYSNWCQQLRKPPVTLSSFGIHMQALNFSKKRITDGVFYENIRLQIY